MEKISKSFGRLYFHDGGLYRIFYDEEYKQLFFEVEFPEEVKDMDIDVGKSMCGLLTFFGVEQASIASNTDYLRLNHPRYSVSILEADYLAEASKNKKEAVRFWFDMSGEGISVQFTSDGFTWLAYDKCC